MGYGAQPWAVDLDRLRADIGSRDERLAQHHAAGFTQRDDDLQWLIDDVIDPPGSVTVADVARHMVMGEPHDERIGFAYGYLLQYLCRVHGTFLDNAGMMPVPVDHAERLDGVLAAKGLLVDGFSIHDLLFGGAPVPLPPIDDFPGIGYREHGTLERPAAALARYGAHDDGSDEFATCSPGVHDVFQWLSAAHRRGVSLVVFFH